jgi:hypothetical protein
MMRIFQQNNKKETVGLTTMGKKEKVKSFSPAYNNIGAYGDFFVFFMKKVIKESQQTHYTSWKTDDHRISATFSSNFPFKSIELYY